MKSFAMRFAPVALLAVLPAPPRALAGITTADVVGTVKDAAGEPIAAATIELVNQELGTKVGLESNDKGRFVQIGLRPGEWKVTVRKAGLGDWSQTVHLGLGVRTPVDAVLAAAPEPAAGAAATSFSLGGVLLSSEAAAAHQQAQAALASGALDEGRAALEKLIALEPALAAPYFALAQLQRQTGETAAAVRSLKLGLERRPDDLEGWLALGEMADLAREPGEAAAAFRKAAEVAPEEPRARKKLALALFQQMDLAGAARELETYLRLAPHADDAAEKRLLLEECRKLAAAR